MNDYQMYKEGEVEHGYSREKYEGYTHRFLIRFEVGEPNDLLMTIFSKSGDFQKLESFINKNKGKKVLSFSIINRSTKEQDDFESEFLDFVLEGI